MNSLLNVAYYITTVNHDDSILFNYLLPILIIANLIFMVVAVSLRNKELQVLAVILGFFILISLVLSVVYRFACLI